MCEKYIDNPNNVAILMQAGKHLDHLYQTTLEEEMDETQVYVNAGFLSGVIELLQAYAATYENVDPTGNIEYDVGVCVETIQ